MATFEIRLKQLRESIKLTQEELAIKLNISRSRLASYEQGKREPDLELLETIADFFNVDIDYLVGRSEITSAISYIDYEPITLAAHKNDPNAEWTEEELQEIADFMEFVKMKRKSRKQDT